MAELKKISLRQYKEFLAYGFYKVGNPRIQVDQAADLVASKNFDMATISKNDLYYADVRTTKCLHINVTDSDRDHTTEYFGSGEKYYTLEHNDVLYLLHDYQWDSGNISFKVVRR